MRNDSTFLLVLGAPLFLTAIFLVAERAVRYLTGRESSERVLRADWTTDVVYLFMTALFTGRIVRYAGALPVVLLLLANVTSFDIVRLGEYHGFGPLSRQPWWLQAIQIYALADLCGYWLHRRFHRGRWWPFHAVHHSSEELDWLGSLRIHPIDEMTNKLLQSAPIMLLGYSPMITVSAGPVLTFYAAILHANVDWDFGPLRTVIATPVFHRWHHSKDPQARDKNFARLLPIWDIVFGTFYMPRDRRPEDFGIHEPMPSGYFGQLGAPFVWARLGAERVDPE